MPKRLETAHTKFGIESDNFEIYFQKQISGITESGKEAMPIDLASKLFHYDGRINQGNVRKLSFLGKLFVLWKCLKKRVWIFIEDEDGGMSAEEFVELRKAIKRRDYGIKKAEGLALQGHFCTVNKEFGDTMTYLNSLSMSPTYNFLNRPKNFKITGTERFVREANYIVRFLRFYEAHKKRWVHEKKLSVPEFYVLIYLYDKEEALGSIMYREFYKRTFHCSERKIKLAFRTLQSRGLIYKHGNTSGARMQITPMGKDMINSILKKYALNC